MLREGDGAGDVEGNAFDADPQGDIRGRLSESGVNHDGVGFRVGQRDVKRQPLHQRDLKVFEFVPQRVVDVQGADGPLEGRTNPQFGGNSRDTWDGVVAGLNAEAFAQRGQPFQGQAHRKVVRAVAIDIDVVLEQDQIGADQYLASERPLVPRLVGRSVVSRREVHVNGVGVDADSKEVVQAEVVN